MISNLVKSIIQQGGSIHPLIIPSELTEGTGLCNPSIFIDEGKIYINIRHVQYALYQSENQQKHPSRYGPLSYINPEDDITLRTKNFIVTLNNDFSIETVNLTDTSKLDVAPIWEFVGLEDARLVKWENKWYQTGVRRDTTTNGEGRMELSEITISHDNVKEISRWRIPAPGNNDTYCEKNWMPINDLPFHYVKWTNPTEIVKIDPVKKTTTTVKTIPQNISVSRDLRGGSSIIKFGDNWLGITHEVDFWYNVNNHKDCFYYHRFVLWDKDWNIIKISDDFTFLDSRIEFCCGLAEHNGDILATFGLQDTTAFLVKITPSFVNSILGINEYAENFDWGGMDIEWIDIMKNEIFRDNIYEKFYQVKKNDVVVDIGANVGSFSRSILDRNPKKVYCIEPSNNLVSILKNNTFNKCIYINKAIDSKSSDNAVIEEDIHIYNHEGTNYETISFNDFIKQNNISKIDFLKIDCEGGEYDIFTPENKEWILSNVKHIAGEWHLWGTRDSLNNFIKFRDEYLSSYKNFKVYSREMEDISEKIFDNAYLTNFSHTQTHFAQVLIYINN